MAGARRLQRSIGHNLSSVGLGVTKDGAEEEALWSVWDDRGRQRYRSWGGCQGIPSKDEQKQPGSWQPAERWHAWYPSSRRYGNRWKSSRQSLSLCTRSLCSRCSAVSAVRLALSLSLLLCRLLSLLSSSIVHCQLAGRPHYQHYWTARARANLIPRRCVELLPRGKRGKRWSRLNRLLEYMERRTVTSWYIYIYIYIYIKPHQLPSVGLAQACPNYRLDWQTHQNCLWRQNDCNHSTCCVWGYIIFGHTFVPRHASAEHLETIH